jgi:hypothetical protein
MSSERLQHHGRVRYSYRAQLFADRKAMLRIRDYHWIGERLGAACIRRHVAPIGRRIFS